MREGKRERQVSAFVHSSDRLLASRIVQLLLAKPFAQGEVINEQRASSCAHSTRTEDTYRDRSDHPASLSHATSDPCRCPAQAPAPSTPSTRRCVFVDRGRRRNVARSFSLALQQFTMCIARVLWKHTLASTSLSLHLTSTAAEPLNVRLERPTHEAFARSVQRNALHTELRSSMCDAERLPL